MKFSFHSDFHFLLVTPPKWFRECLLVLLDILYDLQASLERSGWLNSTPAKRPSAPVEHPVLSNSRMLNKLRRLPFMRSASCDSTLSNPWCQKSKQIFTGLSPSSFLNLGKLVQWKQEESNNPFNRAHVCSVPTGLQYSLGMKNCI